MDIIFEDECIVVCRKDRGVLSQQSDKKEKNMVDLLQSVCVCQIYPVHRLDKDVGGIMVYAKNSKSAADLSEQVANRTAEKFYFALSAGGTEMSSGVMEDFLFFDKSKNKSFVVKKERRGVKKAVLEYEWLRNENSKNLFRVRLITGRTHQIRVQFASRKMPLCGDRRYGSADGEKTIALWCCALQFNHPKTGKRMVFELMPEGDKAFSDFF